MHQAESLIYSYIEFYLQWVVAVKGTGILFFRAAATI